MTLSISEWIKYNKEGMIIGGMVGLAYTIYLASTGADLNLVDAFKKTGLMDQVMGASYSALDIAKTKVGLLFISIGILLGGIIDHIFWPKR